MEEDVKETTWREYTADTLCAILSSLYGGDKNALTFYSDLVGKKKNNDTRTAEEIKRDILAKLTGRR